MLFQTQIHKYIWCVYSDSLSSGYHTRYVTHGESLDVGFTSSTGFRTSHRQYQPINGIHCTELALSYVCGCCRGTAENPAVPRLQTVSGWASSGFVLRAKVRQLPGTESQIQAQLLNHFSNTNIRLTSTAASWIWWKRWHFSVQNLASLLHSKRQADSVWHR